MLLYIVLIMMDILLMYYLLVHISIVYICGSGSIWSNIYMTILYIDCWSSRRMHDRMRYLTKG